MARRKTTDPSIQHQPGQISQDLGDYVVRYVDTWRRPQWVDATAWRSAVEAQSVCVDCRETIISQILSMDWKIDARDSSQRDELKDEIDYYSKLLEYSGEVDYIGLNEWLISDYLDIPFGGAAEIGREGDGAEGRVRWILPLDGATLFPYPNYDYPVGQAVPYNQIEKVFFPKHAINRLMMSPRREITRSGWGCAPPEKIYLALELLNRGDRYYAGLLLDTPEAGILDLGDMAKDSAKAWIESWRTMLAGIDPFKIPVLYEHEKPATFIPFVRSPTELMFDKAILKYAALVTSAYGLSLSDINVPTVSSGGDTLAGSIRGERKTRRTGLARAKKSLVSFWNRLLPPTLQFSFVDLDDEVSVALSRARLANATADQLLVQSRIFSNKELRRQHIADGLMSISLPEEPPEEDFKDFPLPGELNRQANSLGKPVPVSQGGQGEVRSLALEDKIERALQHPDFQDAWSKIQMSWLSSNEQTKQEQIQTLLELLDHEHLDGE